MSDQPQQAVTPAKPKKPVKPKAPPAPKKATEESIVKPIVNFNDGKSHVLEALFKAGNAPILKSVGYVCLKGNFVGYKITSKGDTILSVEVNEPNIRPIAEEYVREELGKIMLENDRI